MHVATRIRERSPRAFLLAVVVCLALPVQALAVDEVTVRVEGETENLLVETKVPIGNGAGWAQPWNEVGELPSKCKDDTAYQAIELATKGQWDRQPFAETIKGEKHTFAAGEEYWIPYYNDNYGDWGICQQHLEDGDTVLMQAAVSGPPPAFIPASVPIAIDPVAPPSEIVELGEVMFNVTAWIPEEIFGEEDPEFPGEHWIIPPSPEVDGVGYTVKSGEAEGVTNAEGEVTLTLEEPGNVTVEASMPESATNWSRAIPLGICVDDGIPSTC